MNIYLDKEVKNPTETLMEDTKCMWEDDSRSRPTKDAEQKAPVSRQTVNAPEIVHKMLISLRASDRGMQWVGSVRSVRSLTADCI